MHKILYDISHLLEMATLPATHAQIVKKGVEARPARIQLSYDHRNMHTACLRDWNRK